LVVYCFALLRDLRLGHRSFRRLHLVGLLVRLIDDAELVLAYEAERWSDRLLLVILVVDKLLLLLHLIELLRLLIKLNRDVLRAINNGIWHLLLLIRHVLWLLHLFRLLGRFHIWDLVLRVLELTNIRLK
jgi:hypothetical protein